MGANTLQVRARGLTIEPPVCVNQYVPEASHQAPRDFRVSGLVFVGEAFDCFAYHFEVTDHCILNHRFSLERFFPSCDVSPNLLGTLENMER